jgi:hypothetical protein
LSTTTGLACEAERSALMKRRASSMPSRYTMMLCVAWSLARKSSTCGMSTEVCGPSDTTLEKPTPFWRAQSSIEAVSAPDCDTSASGPGRASGPATLAFRCSSGRWKPSELGPSRCTPSRLAILRHCAAWSAPMPLEMNHGRRAADAPGDLQRRRHVARRQRDERQVGMGLRELFERALGAHVEKAQRAVEAVGAEGFAQRAARGGLAARVVRMADEGHHGSGREERVQEVLVHHPPESAPIVCRHAKPVFT